MWEIFDKEIKACYSAALEKKKFYKLKPQIGIKYLTRLYSVMIDASDWIGDCDIQR